MPNNTLNHCFLIKKTHFSVATVTVFLIASFLINDTQLYASEKTDKVSSSDFKRIEFQHSNPQSPYEIFRTRAKVVKASIVMFPAEVNETSGQEFAKTESIQFFNDQGFDVFIITNPSKKGLPVAASRLATALTSYRKLINTAGKRLVRTNRIFITGFQSGGNLAARLIERLNENEQPDRILLVSPSGMDKPLTGTVIPQIMPPLHPRGALFALLSGQESKAMYEGAMQYVKKYRGFDGRATAKTVSNQDNRRFGPELLKDNFPDFFDVNQSSTGTDTAATNPAAIPVEGYSRSRHEQKILLVGQEKFQLIMLGNSITNNLETPAYQQVWQQFFVPRKALNLGFSGYRTENLLWNIDHGELDGQSPKVVIVEIGTNNVDEKNYPLRHTAGQLAGGIGAIVNRIREKCPMPKLFFYVAFREVMMGQTRRHTVQFWNVLPTSFPSSLMENMYSIVMSTIYF